MSQAKWATDGDLQIWPLGTPSHRRKPEHKTVIARFCEYGDGNGGRNIRRAVASHNACIGISVGALESGAVERMQHMVDQLALCLNSTRLIMPDAETRDLTKSIVDDARALLKELEG